MISAPRFTATPAVALFLAATFFVTGCTNYTIGSGAESSPGGSYAGSTLNSPVTDQNPHPGGDSSYPASSDNGEMPQPPEKVDQR